MTDWEGEQASVIENGDGACRTPSHVSFTTDAERFVGMAANKNHSKFSNIQKKKLNAISDMYIRRKGRNQSVAYI